MEPRVSLLSADETKEAATAAGVLPQMAELSVFRVLLRQPTLAKAIQDLLIALLFRGSFDARLRELIIMRLGWATGSVYEWTQHWKVATELGVDEADLVAVRDWRAHDHWSAVDRAVLAATDETLESGTICEATWKACCEALPDPQQQLELVGAIGTWRMISGLLRSLQVPLEDGVAPWPPDGLAPDGVGV